MIGSTATIFIVDDEIESCKLLETLLRPEGYVTLCAATGEEAASILKTKPFSSNILIIMLTALIDRCSRLAGLNAGAKSS